MILSKKNKTFQKLKKMSSKKYRNFYQEFLIFSPHLIEEAFKKGIVLKLFTTSKTDKGIFLKPNLMKILNQNKIVYSKVALCKMINHPLISEKILVLENIQDPGNAGILLRSACAFGFRHVFFSDNSVDFYNEKVLNASQGSSFYLFLERGNLENFLKLKKEKKYTICSACVYEKNLDFQNLNDFVLKNKKIILILGNEGSGISSFTKKISDYYLNIETYTVESLNVGVAGSILMYLLK